ncbi:PucR family transcriptional regulator ligand-binding domain-containing protein [Gordonia sputi]|nr:PucR family transcriptional regulator ligand-binding domain-containing protein [Gordonia sputi]
MAAARLTVVAGWDRLDTPVRWVHTSEVLDIAELLTGGELLLIASGFLVESGDDRMSPVHRYAGRRRCRGSRGGGADDRSDAPRHWSSRPPPAKSPSSNWSRSCASSRSPGRSTAA